jgi:hypothetical protein
MENIKEPISLSLTINGGSGKFRVTVYDEETKKEHIFTQVKTGDKLQAYFYFADYAILTMEPE